MAVRRDRVKHTPRWISKYSVIKYYTDKFHCLLSLKTSSSTNNKDLPFTIRHPAGLITTSDSLMDKKVTSGESSSQGQSVNVSMLSLLLVPLTTSCLDVCAGVNVTTERVYWYKVFTDDPEVLAHNATIRRELIQKIVPLSKEVQMAVEKLPEGGGDKLMRNLDEFNDLSQQFINLVRDDKANSKPEVDYLHDRSYPHLVDTDFNEEDMKKNFNWTNRDVERFYEKRVIANDLYIDLQLFYNWYH